MGWQVSWRCVCERCKAAGPLARASVKAEAKAALAGWEVGHFHGCHLHLCPACVAKGLPEGWPDATELQFHWEEAT